MGKSSDAGSEVSGFLFVEKGVEESVFFLNCSKKDLLGTFRYLHIFFLEIL